MPTFSTRDGTILRLSLAGAIGYDVIVAGRPRKHGGGDMIRFGEDSNDLAKLTGRASVVMTYSDLVHSFEAEQAKFPDSVLVLIDRGLGDPTGKASIADVETGAFTPAQIRDWVLAKMKAGIRFITVYVNRSNIGMVQEALRGLTVYWWVATLDGTCHIDGFTALATPTLVQCFTAAMLGLQADGSLIFDDGWHPQHTGGNVLAAVKALEMARNRIADATAEIRQAEHQLNAA